MLIKMQILKLHKIIHNAKLRNTAICGATETILIHEKIIKKIGNQILKNLEKMDVKLLVIIKLEKLIIKKLKKLQLKIGQKNI